MKLIFLFTQCIHYCLLTFVLTAQPKPEFRGVWVATVDNIDWPSRGNYNPDLQKSEFIHLLNLHQRNGINAVIVQIRPSADAFYPSKYEPWSQWLNGTQGKPPYPFYDPLKFMITETHKRGMEFHAWINPYRAVFNIKKSSVSPTHITKTHPEWFLTYGNVRYFDPGNKNAQQFVASIVSDIVHRYDIDAIHFDDYFYPYKIVGREFPDYATYKAYGKGMNKSDWRRSNVDSIIVMLGKAIKKENPKCRFGISPFGVWRNNDKDPNGSNTKAGQTNYDDLYADILLWLKNGWIDYVAPQLYWEIGHKQADYEVLLDWWNRHTYGRHCYIGLGIYRANTNSAWRDKNQLPKQIQELRSKSNLQGMVYFSSSSFEENPNGWNDSLQNRYNVFPVLPPPMPWLDNSKPPTPQINSIGLSKKENSCFIRGEMTGLSKNIKAIMVYIFEKEKATPEKLLPFTFNEQKFNLKIPLRSKTKIKSIGITTVSKTNVESAMQIFQWRDE